MENTLNVAFGVLEELLIAVGEDAVLGPSGVGFILVFPPTLRVPTPFDTFKCRPFHGFKSSSSGVVAQYSVSFDCVEDTFRNTCRRDVDHLHWVRLIAACRQSFPMSERKADIRLRRRSEKPVRLTYPHC